MCIGWIRSLTTCNMWFWAAITSRGGSNWFRAEIWGECRIINWRVAFGWDCWQFVLCKSPRCYLFLGQYFDIVEMRQGGQIEEEMGPGGGHITHTHWQPRDATIQGYFSIVSKISKYFSFGFILTLQSRVKNKTFLRLQFILVRYFLNYKLLIFCNL